MIHAEGNAVAHAARHGVKLKGATAYVTHMCCKNCADLLIQAGIKTVVYGKGKLVGDWQNDIAEIKFKEAGVNFGKAKHI